MPVDAKGERVLTFQMSLQNAGRLGTYAKNLVEMFASKDWRAYSTALGVYEWRAREFDYFLISVGARHEDIAELSRWKTVKASELVPAMTGEPGPHRRPLSVASEAWKSPTGQSLVECAEVGGWIRKDRPGHVLKIAPAPHRARLRAEGVILREDRTRRNRRARLSADQRTRLDHLVEELLRHVGSVDELHYVFESARRIFRSKNGKMKSAPRRATAR